MYKIDSLRLITDSEIARPDLPEQMLVSDGEIIHEFKEKALEVVLPNTATIYILRKKYNFTEEKRGDVTIILLSAKAAGKQYLSGIRRETIKYVLEHLKEKAILNYQSIETYMEHTKTRDIDVCFDIKMTKEEFSDSMINLEHQIDSELKNTHKLGKGYQITDTHERAQMLQINRRKGSSITNPFVKFYNKSLEMGKKAKEKTFRDLHKIEVPYHYEEQNTIRTEFTLSDNYTIETFIGSTYLPDILNFNNWNKVYNRFYSEIFTRAKTDKRSKSEISGKDLIIYYLFLIILNFMNNQLSKNEKKLRLKQIVDNEVINYIKDRTAKHRAKKTVDKILKNL